MNTTPNATRLHVAIFGRRNSGKSSLINAITKQDTSLTSPIAGTTTDAVAKAMEIAPIGACLFIDTPGFDDSGTLGEGRITRTLKTLERTDVALMLCDDESLALEKQWCDALRKAEIPIIAIINKCDVRTNTTRLSKAIEQKLSLKALEISAIEGFKLEPLRDAILAVMPADFGARSIVGDLVAEGDTVLLVMPQDIQAPKGRLILPQVQTLRELLDKKCIVMSTTTDTLEASIRAMAQPPKLIITDSQVFKEVYAAKPKESLLTSFSVLMAGYKGDIETLIEGAAAIDSLTPTSRVLIAEACTHAPLTEDIGRVKLPRLLRNRVGEELMIDIVAGRDFPTDLSPYSLIIHCGGCMFNRRYVLSRLEAAKTQGVAITNYGIAIAHLGSILDKVVYPR